MKNFKEYLLYSETPMSLEDIPNTKMDSDIYKMAQDRIKGTKKLTSPNPLVTNTELKKSITSELTDWFTKVKENFVNLSIEDVDFTIKNKVAFLNFKNSKMNKDYELLMKFYFDKTDIELFENNFSSGEKIKVERNKIARKLKTLETKIRPLVLQQKKLFNSKKDTKVIDLEVQFIEENIDELREGLKSMNATLKYIVGGIVEKETNRSNVQTQSSIKFELEPIAEAHSFYRTHFVTGIPNFLKGKNIGYKLYLALANKLKVIFSARNTTHEAKAIWLKLLTEEKDFYSFFLKESAFRGIIKNSVDDTKIKQIVATVINYEETLIDKKDYSDQAEALIVYRMLKNNKKFSSILEKFENKLNSLEEFKDAITTFTKKSKDQKLKAEANQILIKIKKIKTKKETVQKFNFIFKVKDFLNQVKDPGFSERLNKIFKKELELL